VSHDHGHEHHGHGGGGHSHSHAPADFGRAFVIGILLNTGFIVLEVIFGLLSDSLALLADAGHNLSDVFGLVLAWVASLLAKRVATSRRTYGWKRSTVLAALFNALLLLIGVGAIAWEAIQRFGQPPAVSGITVAWVAALGIAVNGGTALLFMAGRKSDLNVRGAFLHMASDAAVSAGVMLSGVVIYYTHWGWLDPVVSLAVALFIFLSTWALFMDSLNFSLDVVPAHIDPEKVQAFFLELPQIKAVHHLHIWPLSTTEVALTVHLVKRDPTLDDALLAHIKEELEHDFGIAHPTIQFETTEECATAEGKHT